jgi:hypothetical protein
MAKEEDESNKKEVEFLVVDVDVGKGHDVAKDICGVDIGELKEGPIFVLFRNGKKVSVSTGVLRTRCFRDNGR